MRTIGRVPGSSQNNVDKIRKRQELPVYVDGVGNMLRLLPEVGPFVLHRYIVVICSAVTPVGALQIRKT